MHDDVFVWTNDEQALLYNAKSFKQISIQKKQFALFRLCYFFEDNTNLYFEYDTNDEICDSIDFLVDNSMGRISTLGEIDCRIPPIVSINNDWNRNIPEVERTKIILNTNVLVNLHTITIYIGGNAPDNKYFLQMPYPLNSYESISFHHLNSIIHNCLQQCDGDIQFKLVFSDYQDSEILSFAHKLQTYCSKISFIFLLRKDMNVFEYIQKMGYKVVLIIDIQFDNSPLHSLDKQFEYQILIRNESDLSTFDRLKKSLYTVYPQFIAENNEVFFKNNIFLNREELTHIQCSKHLIFLHQKLNINFWGQLFVYPNGDVFSSSERTFYLGKITLPLTLLVQRELIQTNAWQHIRNNFHCSSCIYQWLCPSPTIIEHIFKRNTICNLFNN